MDLLTQPERVLLSEAADTLLALGLKFAPDPHPVPNALGQVRWPGSLRSADTLHDEHSTLTALPGIGSRQRRMPYQLSSHVQPDDGEDLRGKIRFRPCTPVSLEPPLDTLHCYGGRPPRGREVPPSVR